MTIRPVMFSWHQVDVCVDGGEVRRSWAMIPQPRFLPLCKRQYADGEEYALGPVENVPHGSRGGFFVQVRETWNSLPEDDERYPTQEHLRKRALVAAGWASHAQYVMETPKDARQMAQALRRADEYAVIKMGGNVVEVWTAKSIAGGQITAEEWKDVKPRALAFLARLTGTTTKALVEHSRDGGGR